MECVVKMSYYGRVKPGKVSREKTRLLLSGWTLQRKKSQRATLGVKNADCASFLDVHRATKVTYHVSQTYTFDNTQLAVTYKPVLNFTLSHLLNAILGKT